jgi:hypothetical protein
MNLFTWMKEIDLFAPYDKIIAKIKILPFKQQSSIP